MKLNPLLGKVDGNKIIGLLGGEDPVGTTPKVAKTQAEIEVANREAKRFAKTRGLVSGENTYVAKKVGDKLPQYIDSKTGKPFVPLPSKSLAMSVPSGITASDIKTDGQGSFWYDDQTTGDIVDIDPSVLNSPRFKKSDKIINDDMALRASKLLGSK